jgi:hypothetical protein
VRPLDREAGEGGESLCVGRFGNFRQAGKGGIGLFSREARSVVEPPGRFNSALDRLEVVQATIFYGFADQVLLRSGSAAVHCRFAGHG